MGIKYEMKTEKPEKMGNKEAQELKNIVLAPYMQLATGLIGKARHAGGNMFRHQMDTLAILIDYGYIDSVLLKASVVHDTVEDILMTSSNMLNFIMCHRERIVSMEDFLSITTST